MVENYIIGVLASLTVTIIPKLFGHFMMNIQEKINPTIRGLQFSVLFIFLIYSYLIFNSEGIHKFILGLFLIVTIVGWLYFVSGEIYKNSSTVWLRAKDIVRKFNVGYFQLKQHVLNGLPIYRFDDPIQFINDSIKPMDKEDIAFMLSYDDALLRNDMKDLLFKQQDIKKYLTI